MTDVPLERPYTAEYIEAQLREAGFWRAAGPGHQVWFGDGGTASTMLAIGYRFADEKRKALYLGALERYATFVMKGCLTAPPGRGQKGSPGWVIAEGPDKGALGCGYYRGRLSILPYTTATATTGC